MDLLDILIEKFSKTLMKKNKSVGTTRNSSFTDKANIMKEFQKGKISYQNSLNRNLNLLMNGKIDRESYLIAQRETITGHFQNSYYLGKTFAQSVETKLSSDEIRSIGQQVGKEMSFMSKFADDVLARKGKMDYSRRMKMYAEGVTPMFIFGQMVYLPEDAKIKWVLGETDKHCLDCLVIAANSPYTKKTLPTVPRACDSRCLSNCACSLHFPDIGPNDDYVYYLMKNYSPNGENIPEPAEVVGLQRNLSSFYFHRGNAHLDKDKAEMKLANDERTRYRDSIKNSNLAVKNALPTSRYLKELDLFNKNPNFERIKSGEGSVNKVVSVHSNGIQMYGVVKRFDTGFLYVNSLAGDLHMVDLTTAIVFKEK